MKLSTHLGLTDFKASDGWLWRLRKRHSIRNVAVTGEAEIADMECVSVRASVRVSVNVCEGVFE